METPTRQEFFHISQSGQVLFYVLAFLSIAVLIALVEMRRRQWLKGRVLPWEVRPTAKRLKGLWQDVMLQRKVRQSRKRYGAPMHLLLFFGFFALTVATTILAINHWAPENLKFYKGDFFLIYETTFDIFGVFFLVGLLMAIGRRYVSRPKSLGNSPGDAWLLGSLLVITVTGYLNEALRIKLDPHSWSVYSPVGFLFSHALPDITPQVYQIAWWFHVGLVFVFLATIPLTRMRHIIYAIFSIYYQPLRSRGELLPVSIAEVEETGKVGAVVATDYNRWQLTSADACMECGRCTDVCPANLVGKVLDPKQIVQGVLLALKTGNGLAGTLTEEALWECTTCNACVRECPVNIRHVDLIVDARRALVAEGRLTGPAATVLRQIGSTGSAWGATGTDREAWMEGLNVPLVRNGVEFDVLLWVGCAGAVDKGAQKTNRALVKIFQQAGIKFACLGNDEVCTGDPARRIGEEFLYQQMAEANVGTLNAAKVRTVVASCPHCFNTMKNEYPQFDGLYEVMHHSQFLAKLMSGGRLKPAKRNEKVVWHDPCYLARVNHVVDAPRDALKSVLGDGLLMPTASGEKTLCCGAGGGRMWMEEPANQRPGIRRAEQLLATGAKTIAVGCPFCRIMVGDSARALTGDDSVSIVDMAELLILGDQ